MITLRNVSKSFGAQTLFEEAFLQINDRDRFALVGPNGAGKSTLFKMILGQEEPDEGDLILRGGVNVGFLPQELTLKSKKSVIDETTNDNHEDPRRQAKAKKILMGLGFRVDDFEKPMNTLSGGWNMRVGIAKLLVDEPDLLMLDEPTNHLDLESLLWFQDYLIHFKGAVFIISHDREFINAVTNRIVEVDQGHLKTYRGSYEDYLAERKKQAELLEKNYYQQQKEIKKLETYISRFRAKADLAASVQSKIRYLDKMEKIELPETQKTVGFSFPQPSRTGHNTLVLKHLNQTYDGKTFVYHDLNLILERGQRIALVGPNGAGKSTLLKLLGGVLPFHSGERKVGLNVEVRYFSQHRAEMFKEGRTVFQEAVDTPRSHSETTIRTILGSFLFRGDAIYKKINVLSGGEKSRLGLAKILLNPPNLLLMDEPTTHLDLNSVEVLIQALKDYEGSLCFISHDVYFIRQLADNIIHVDNGLVTWYPGDYDYYLHKRKLEKKEGKIGHKTKHKQISVADHQQAKEKEKQAISSAEQPKSNKKKDRQAQKRREAEERNEKYRKKLARKKKDQERAELEEERDLLMKEMTKPQTHQNPKKVTDIMKKLGELKKKLKKYNEN